MTKKDIGDILWCTAKEQARMCMYGVAAKRSVIAYSSLVTHIIAVPLDMHFLDHRTLLSILLGEISTEERTVCGSMLSAVVIGMGSVQDEERDLGPGKGFYDLAIRLGYVFRNTADGRLAFWVDQLNQLYDNMEALYEV